MTPLRALLLPLLATAALVLTSCGGDDVSVQSGGDGDGTGGSADTAGGADSGTRPSLEGDWRLVAFTVDGEAVEVPAQVDLDMTIEANTIQGLGGCNQFSGALTFDEDGTVTIGDLLSTEMACEMLDFEAVYLPALAEVNQWEVTPEGLTFRGDGTEMSYEHLEAEPPVALEETIWTFDSVFSGEGVERTASTPRIDKPEVTLVISGGEATLTSEDCGPVSFAIGYEPGVDGSIAFPDPDALVVSCDDDESNMVVALEGISSATGFMIYQSQLTFIGLPGETVGFVAGS